MTTLKQAYNIGREVIRHANMTDLIASKGVDKAKASEIAFAIMMDEKAAARRKRARAKDEKALNDFNYVGSRHHY